MVFIDQSRVERVRDALWGTSGNGTYAVIGSGFSRCAETLPDAPPSPLLADVLWHLDNELYPQSGIGNAASALQKSRPAQDASKLAEDYEANFGSDRLYELLERLVRDKDHQPGEMHSRLMRLPWRDVFTTNWDTLLERTAHEVPERGYSLVTAAPDIPSGSHPYIYKLHGSFRQLDGSRSEQHPLILTAGSYRTYRNEFAPFANAVQQAMMESVSCLIGFSGDDPNFYEWSGWVRDNLGEAAPKIYLAGYLELSEPRRVTMEKLGIFPIDLAKHPSAEEWRKLDPHQKATEWIIEMLEDRTGLCRPPTTITTT